MTISNDNSPFFLVGSDRSGTTLLRLMLNEHPRLHVPRESWFLSDLMDQVPIMGPLSPEQVLLAREIIRVHPRWCEWELDDERLIQGLAKLDSPDLARVVEVVYRISSDSVAKPRWGDKTPRYIHDLPRLHRLFPSARFLHIIRDGRDVCLSLRHVGWHGRTTYEIAEYWSRAIRAGADFGRRVGPSVYREVAYEDLVLNTESALRGVCEFLNESYHPAMLAYHTRAKELIAPSEKEFHTKLSRLPEEADAFRWRREMSPLQIALFEAYAGPAMDLMGQPRRFAGPMRAIPFLARPLMEALRLTRPVRHCLGLRRRSECDAKLREHPRGARTYQRGANVVPR